MALGAWKSISSKCPGAGITILAILRIFDEMSCKSRIKIRAAEWLVIESGYNVPEGNHFLIVLYGGYSTTNVVLREALVKIKASRCVRVVCNQKRRQACTPPDGKRRRFNRIRDTSRWDASLDGFRFAQATGSRFAWPVMLPCRRVIRQPRRLRHWQGFCLDT